MGPSCANPLKTAEIRIVSLENWQFLLIDFNLVYISDTTTQIYIACIQLTSPFFSLLCSFPCDSSSSNPPPLSNYFPYSLAPVDFIHLTKKRKKMDIKKQNKKNMDTFSIYILRLVIIHLYIWFFGFDLNNNKFMLVYSVHGETTKF